MVIYFVHFQCISLKTIKFIKKWCKYCHQVEVKRTSSDLTQGGQSCWHLIWTCRFVPARAGWLFVNTRFKLQRNHLLVWRHKRRLKWMKWMKWMKCHIALSLVEKNTKITSNLVSIAKKHEVPAVVKIIKSTHWYLFIPLRYLCVLWMWAPVIFQYVKVWALYSLACLLRDDPRGQRLQTPWSMGTPKGRLPLDYCTCYQSCGNRVLCGIPGLLWEVWQWIGPWVLVRRTKRRAITLLNIQQLTHVHP